MGMMWRNMRYNEPIESASICVIERLAKLLPYHSYRRPAPNAMCTTALFSEVDATTASSSAFKTEWVTDVEAAIEAAGHQAWKVRFSVFTSPNHFCPCKDRKLLGHFMLDIYAAKRRVAILDAMSSFIDAYIAGYKWHPLKSEGS